MSETLTSAPRERSWQQHYQAMQRWKTRAIDCAGGEITARGSAVDIDNVEADDFACAFFIWAHALRDWLISGSGLNEQEIDTALNRHNQWLLVRDLANKITHQKISRNPKDADWISGIKIDPNALDRGEHGIEPYIFHDGKYLSYADCIESVWRMWSDVLKELRLEVES